MDAADELRPPGATASEPLNPSPELDDKLSKVREEGELSSDDEDAPVFTNPSSYPLFFAFSCYFPLSYVGLESSHRVFLLFLPRFQFDAVCLVPEKIEETIAIPSFRLPLVMFNES